ncbi:MAG: DUF5777 family beta-barrel protein [Melioribacteraceae bacterium]|nr:DUF5777 family beta-barrel protein [Melioribacteraceae bacterium]
MSFVVVIETEEHLFDFMPTNNARLNDGLYLVGADQSASDNEWRKGFAVLRYF